MVHQWLKKKGRKEGRQNICKVFCHEKNVYCCKTLTAVLDAASPRPTNPQYAIPNNRDGKTGICLPLEKSGLSPCAGWKLQWDFPHAEPVLYRRLSWTLSCLKGIKYSLTLSLEVCPRRYSDMWGGCIHTPCLLCVALRMLIRSSCCQMACVTTVDHSRGLFLTGLFFMRMSKANAHAGHGHL